MYHPMKMVIDKKNTNLEWGMGSTKKCVSNNNMPPSNKTFPGTVIMTVLCVLIIYHYIYYMLTFRVEEPMTI
jgi:hypothetical protein